MSDTYKALAAKLHNISFGDVPLDWKETCLLLIEARDAIDVLSDPARNDFAHYQAIKTELELSREKMQSSSYRHELDLMRYRCAELLSQAKPLCDLDIDREKVRQVLHYVQCGRLK